VTGLRLPKERKLLANGQGDIARWPSDCDWSPGRVLCLWRQGHQRFRAKESGRCVLRKKSKHRKCRLSRC